MLPNLVPDGDTDKLSKLIYHLINTGANLPLRLPLGKDAITALRAKAAEWTKGADEVERYSDDLLVD